MSGSAEREASILHADLDSFFASVEQRDDPALLGRPTIVGAGVVLAASYEAKAFGVRTAMGAEPARRMCRDAVVVPPRFDAYVEASKQVFAVFADITPVVEGISIDEAFLDVSGRRREATPTQLAQDLRRQVRERVGLPISVGIAATKFLAKIASAAAKPDGLLLVPVGTEIEFLHPLPIEALWGVGPKTSARLRDRGVQRIGDLATVGEASLVAMLGPAAGRHLYALACNRDSRPVRAGRRRASVGAQRAMGLGRFDAGEVDSTLLALVDRVTRRLRKGGRVGSTVTLRLRFADSTRATRSRSLPQDTAHTETILAAARALLRDAEQLIAGRPITLVGVTVSNLRADPPVQLALPFTATDAEAIDRALDAVRAKFGSGSVLRAAVLGGGHDDRTYLL